MCPQSGLVDGVSRVGGADPEQHDDAVDTSEADESTEGEDTVQCELVLPATVQTPNHRDWEDEDDKVHDDVEGLVDNEEDVRIEAFSGHTMVPVGAERNTLTGAGEEDAEAPGANEAV